MQIPVDRQRELYRRHAQVAVDRLLQRLADRRDQLVALGEQRAFATVGVFEYGDRTYRKGDRQLADETAAELADAIFYEHILLARAAGDLDDIAVPPDG